MRLFSMRSGRAFTRMVQAGAALGVAALVAGCGNSYRPVVTPISTSGPSAQITSYTVAVSAPSTTSGVATIIDYSGDTVLAYANIGAGPQNFVLDELGAEAYTVNRDGTLTNFPISTTLQTKNVLYSTVNSTSNLVNLLAPASGMWAPNLTSNTVDLFYGSPMAYKLSVPVATSPVFVAGAPTASGQRQYVIAQNFTDSTGVACNTAATSQTVNGLATPVEMSTDTADSAISLGVCPVYAVQTPDLKRLFVVNRGDDTVTVINTQNNALDSCTPYTSLTGRTVTCHPTLPLSQKALTATSILPVNCASKTATACAAMPSVAQPVYAEYNALTQQLVVSDYAGGTISIIDVTLDEYGNDSDTFGTTYTVAVGNTSTPYPASLSVLYDGSKAYTANQGDDNGDGNGTISVVNLTTHTLEKTLEVVGHPRTVVTTQNSSYAKAYAGAPDSNLLTIIQTTPTATDVIDTTIALQGELVDVRVTTLNGSSGNINYISRTPGYGLPCNLPPTKMTTTTLATCRQIP